ncbi:MAG: hypothetical protein HXY20_08860 [Acidobacteria bacterium]|nr:hypothetical protein [Acidobacteriota bacterium]
MPRRNAASRRIGLPGITELRAGEEVIRVNNSRIPHRKILAALEAGWKNEQPGGLVEIYRTRVMPVKTRTIQLLGHKSSPRIVNTLLGYEVQAAYKRVHCPDIVTARYLKLFTEIGCRSIRIPYDPTVTAGLLPAMEASVERVRSGVARLFPENRAVRTYVLRRIYRCLRDQLRKLQPAPPAAPAAEDEP